MNDVAVARVYAQALFDAARDAGSVERVGRELGDFAAALAASEPLRHALFDPRLAASAKQRVVAELSRDADRLLQNALQVVVEKGRAQTLPQIAGEYATLAKGEEGVVRVTVTSAVPLADEQSARLAERVAQSMRRPVELDHRVDPGVIGGLVLRIGDVIVDASVKGRIRQLQRRLQTVEV
jgi:F-type H+-transporting ATPase subunit delta